MKSNKSNFKYIHISYEDFTLIRFKNIINYNKKIKT